MIADTIIETEEECLDEDGTWDDEQRACYIGYKESVRVGDKYREVHVDGKAVTEGDIATFDDPDTHPENNVHQRVFVGEVEDIYHCEGHEPEIGTSMPLGRIEANSRYTEVSGEGSRAGDTQKFIEDYLSEREDNPDVESIINEWDREGDWSREVRD